VEDIVRDYLEPRVGKDALARRLEIERTRCSKNGVDSPSRRYARFICSTFLFFCKCTLLYRWGYRQFHALRITENPLRIRNLPKAFEGFRIMHLSDLHLDLDPAFTRTLVEKISQCSFDVCVMTGDYRNFLDSDDSAMLAEMRKVTEAISKHGKPVYAVMGNHDALDSVPTLESMGIRFLLNEHVVLHKPCSTGTVTRGKKDECLVIAGIDDPNVYATHDIPRALDGAPSGAPVILLSHSPSGYRDALTYDIAALLAGHLHGGQVCLPGGIMVRCRESSPRRMWKGAWQNDDGKLQGYTSTGSGGCGVPLRFFSHPEIVIHILQGND